VPSSSATRRVSRRAWRSASVVRSGCSVIERAIAASSLSCSLSHWGEALACLVSETASDQIDRFGATLTVGHAACSSSTSRRATGAPASLRPCGRSSPDPRGPLVSCPARSPQRPQRPRSRRDIAQNRSAPPHSKHAPDRANPEATRPAPRRPAEPRTQQLTSRDVNRRSMRRAGMDIKPRIRHHSGHGRTSSLSWGQPEPFSGQTNPREECPANLQRSTQRATYDIGSRPYGLPFPGVRLGCEGRHPRMRCAG
jgi:hypothetical protein